jgi:hypothetical protein
VKTKYVVTANSPGEIAWLKVVAHEFFQRGLEVEVLLLPCNFATGKEADVAKTFEGVAAVHPVSSFFKLLLWQGKNWGPDVRLLHLGGDLMYTSALSWRWGWKCWSYFWARPWWDSAFRGYFARDGEGVAWLQRKRIPLSKIKVVGDLVADTVATVKAGQTKRHPGKQLIALMPGSRVVELRFITPFLLEVAEELNKEFTDLHFQLLLSPFRQGEDKYQILGGDGHPTLSGLTGRIVHQDGLDYLQSDNGTQLELVEGDTLQALAQADFAITIPGTKTGQAGALGVPCLMLFPLNNPQFVPLIGLLGLLDHLPGGSWLKGKILAHMKKSVGLLAQPNQRAGRYLMPEMVEHLTLANVVGHCRNFLADPVRAAEIRQELKTVYDPLRGAAKAMVEEMIQAS